MCRTAGLYILDISTLLSTRKLITKLEWCKEKHKNKQEKHAAMLDSSFFFQFFSANINNYQNI